MIISQAKNNLVIETGENIVPVLVIEDPEVFADFTGSFFAQCAGVDGSIVLSDDSGIFTFSKTAILVTDYYGLDINSRRVQSRLYQSMRDIGVELGKEKDDFTRCGIEIIEKLLNAARFDHVDYNLEIDWNDFFKLFQVRIAEDYVTIAEKLIEFIKVCSQLLDIRLIAFVNLKSYVSHDELLEIYRMAVYLKVNLLLIESAERESFGPEKYYIIDKDKCLIIK